MVLYYVRVEPLRRDVKAKEVEDVLRDFGTIHSVRIHRASPYPRYNRISKKRDIFDDTYATVAFTDSHARRVAILNIDNTLKHPVTKQFYAMVESAKMGAMEVRRAIRVREYEPVSWGQWGKLNA
ncbi:hypothetical protein AAVH_13254 [Aphelenchoides avenae]|nr:hypothetical protein AAVH_13254 [Aphelenchus avenae]